MPQPLAGARPWADLGTKIKHDTVFNKLTVWGRHQSWGVEPQGDRAPVFLKLRGLGYTQGNADTLRIFISARPHETPL